MPARMFFMRAVILRKLTQKCNGICRQFPVRASADATRIQLLLFNISYLAARRVLADSHSRKITLV